jgi:hypothetical protein
VVVAFGAEVTSLSFSNSSATSPVTTQALGGDRGGLAEGKKPKKQSKTF